jgi:hypothetical protein
LTAVVSEKRDKQIKGFGRGPAKNITSTIKRPASIKMQLALFFRLRGAIGGAGEFGPQKKLHYPPKHVKLYRVTESKTDPTFLFKIKKDF